MWPRDKFMVQELPLPGPLFSIREDQNLGPELNKGPVCPVSRGDRSPLARLSLMLCPHCLQLWGPRSEPGEASHGPGT